MDVNVILMKIFTYPVKEHLQYDTIDPSRSVVSTPRQRCGGAGWLCTQSPLTSCVQVSTANTPCNMSVLFIYMYMHIYAHAFYTI
jgi:hypothetical protein